MIREAISDIDRKRRAAHSSVLHTRHEIVCREYMKDSFRRQACNAAVGPRDASDPRADAVRETVTGA